MHKPKVRAFRIELAICIGAPLLVLAVIAIFGYGHIRSLRGEIAQRESVLDEIPVVEHRLQVAEQLLAPYRVRNGGKDKSGELSQQVSGLATEHGIKVKTVNAEKVMVPGSPHSLDYNLAMTGEGLGAILIHLIDSLDEPAQCVKVASLRLRPKTLRPIPVYDADLQFHYRFLPSQSLDGIAPTGNCHAQFNKLGVSLEALKKVAKEKKTLLDLTRLEMRSQPSSQELVRETPEAPISFKLNGIAEDGHRPLALTDRGVFGVGDSIDGYRVITVTKDHIVVEGRLGRRVLVTLYRNGETP
jgi:hypothetical protein